MKTLILLATSLLLTLPSFASTDDEFVSVYMKGREAFSNQDYNSAIVFFEKALQILNIDPVEAGKHHKELKADIERHPKSKSGSGADRVVAFIKEWLDSYYYLGLAYAHKGDEVSALKQVTDLRHIGRDDYADPLESEINDIINIETPTR